MIEPSDSLEGRDHLHHFRQEPDGVLRCWRCGVTVEEFKEQERAKEAAREPTL